MEIKYIFLKKKINKQRDPDSKVPIRELMSPVKPMLKKVFNDVTDSSFNIDISGSSYTIKYKYSDNHLTLNIEGNSIENALLLDNANKKLLHGEHRKDYAIVTTFDGISHHYCNQIYPQFNLFERKIRELIFNILIQSFGPKWYDETVSDQLDTELKAQSKSQKSKLIELALYEMTISQLETYLFEPYRDVDPCSLVDSALSIDLVNDMSKSDIINNLNKSRPISLWDRFFADTLKIDNLQSILSAIREYRNKVAHCKFFYRDDYEHCNKLLTEIIFKLDRAIEEIEDERFKEKDLTIKLSSDLSKLLIEHSKKLSELSKCLAPIKDLKISINPETMDSIHEISAILSKTIKSNIEPNKTNK